MSRSINAFGAGSSSDDSDEDQDDYLHPSTDPNADEFADYNPRKRRRTERDAKESAALGIFGSESEDEGPGKRWKSKNIRGRGMAFVKSGEMPAASDDGEEMDDSQPGDAMSDAGENEEDEEAAMEDTESYEQTAGLRMGLGARKPASQNLGSRGYREAGLGSSGSAGGGLGWQSPAARRLGGGLGSSTSSPLGRGFVPSSAAIPILQNNDDEKPAAPRMAMPSAFSTPTASKSGRGNKSEKSTPINAGSFAARMMAKMGYKEGQGLGKEGQGRSGVIEVQLRPQGVGLGAVKEKSKQERDEEKRQAARRGEVLEDSEDEERKRRRKPKTSGTDSGASTPKRRPKPKYQSLPELQRAAPGLKIPEAFTPILDMTGPGQKLLTSSSGLLTPTTGTESTELIEARKLARRAQSDVTAFVEEWKNLEERKAWIEMEILQQQQFVDEQKTTSDQISSAASIVLKLSESVKDNQWDPVMNGLLEVEKLGIAGNDDLANVAVAAVHPFFRQATEGWQPLDDPKLSGVAEGGFAPALLAIRELLGVKTQDKSGNGVNKHDPTSNSSYYGRSHKTTPYESMMYTIWFPKVRSAITNSWDVHNPTSLQAFFHTWESLIPPFIRSQILDQLVVRKLDEAVTDWNPKKRRTNTLPHLWLFPWLQYLPAHHVDPKSSTGLVSDVKRKFRRLIDTWDFMRGVIPGLQQWRDVLQPAGQNDQWTPLIVNHVLPNLARFFRVHFQVAPQDQEPYMQYLNQTLAWQDILGANIMGQLLVDELFPMWHDVLHQWLTLDGVNYLEVGEWFSFWRSIIPEAVNAVPAVKAEWQRGDALINRAVDLGADAKSSLPAPERPTLPGRAAAAPETPAKPAVAPAPEVEELTSRHRVEEWCMDRDFRFIPERSTLEAHGPVYRITAAASGKGGVLAYFRADNIFAQIKRGVWTDLGKVDSDMFALEALAAR